MIASHLAGVLTLQRLAGNAATTEAVAVQRMSGRGRHHDESDLAYGSLPGPSSSGRRREDDDSDLAYGSYYGSPSPEETSFRGSVGGVRFEADSNGGLMRRIFSFVARAAPHFSQELSAAGSVTVRLGRTQGGTPGEWRAGSRTIMLDPRRANPDHLSGTAVFEILNAAAERRVAELEADVLGGSLDVRAKQAGWDPAQFFAMEVERIEWRNGMRHREIVAGSGGSAGANLFAAEGDFNAFYQRQVAAGHTHSYTFRYHLLRAQAASDEARRNEQSQSSAQSGHGHQSSSHRSDTRHRSHRQ